MLVKICANKSLSDAKMSIDAGADFLGMLVGQKHDSSDFIDKYIAKEIVNFAKGKIQTVLVTHLTNSDKIIELTKFIGNDVIQLHSNIDECEVEKIVKTLPNINLIRLIHIFQNGQICTNYKTMKYVDYYLLDSFNLKTDQVGGTSLIHNWNIDRELIKQLNKPTFIAGGLTPQNVVSAIKTAKPSGVDVNSGCKLNGIKNEGLVKKFVFNAKNVQLS